MPCMTTGASDGMAPPWLADEQRAAVERHVLEPFPLGAQPVAVHRVVQRAGEGADRLAAAPVVDPPEVSAPGSSSSAATGRRGTAGAVGVGADEAQRRVGDAGTHKR